jgi:hypothetical protein
MSILTPELIESTINALPPQGRIMLRLLLLQYLDPTQEDIQYIALDRPDPRMLAGARTKVAYVTKDSLQSIADRIAQYRIRMRQHRERLWLQIECLRKQIALTEAYCTATEQLLMSRFAMERSAVEELKASARSAVVKPALRQLETAWDQQDANEPGQNPEVAVEEYRKSRLRIEYVLFRRKLDRERRRLDNAQREQDIVSLGPLQDHELAHVWGIPSGTLAARKVKFLHQYLQGLQAALKQTGTQAEAATPPTDLWRETFVTLARRPVQRSVATYDGLERTEAQLMEKLTALTHGNLVDDAENRLWQAMTQEAKHAGEYGSTTQSLFGLQRYDALLNEVDRSPEAIEQELLARVSPKPKAAALLPASETSTQLGDMAQHVLRSFTGEDHSDTRAKR